MTNALIPVITGTLAGQPAHLVDGRDLHTFLGVGRDFTNWIKERIQQYGFEADKDFIVCSPNSASKDKDRGGHNRTDYHLSLDMAKELAMVERTAKGREARRYFIDCERRLLQGSRSSAGRARSLITAQVARSCPDATAVTWNGVTLYLIDHSGTPYVPLRQLVGVLGLDWHHQHARSHAQVECRQLRVPTPGGRQKATCIPLRLLGDWLAELGDYHADHTVAAAQRTLVDALWAQWQPRAAEPAPEAENPGQALTVPSALQAAIHTRAWQLAQHAYQSYVMQMLDDPRLADGRQTVEKWAPPDAEILDRVDGIATTLEDFAVAMRQRGQRLARQMGRLRAAARKPTH